MRAGAVAEYQNDRGERVLKALDQIAAAHKSTPSAVSLAWLRAKPAVSTPIASARTVSQLQEIVELVQLTADEIQLLDAASAMALES